MITAPAAIRIRALIPDPAAIRIGQAMSMPRLMSQCPPATGVPNASGMGMAGASAACAFAANQVATVSVPRRRTDAYGPLLASHARLSFSLRSLFGRHDDRLSVFGTSVWTGRALQVGYDSLEIIGLAHLYSAL